MAMLGGAELLVLLALSQPIDVASFIAADDYFRIRGLDARVEKLLDMAGKTPSSPGEEIAQLLALRKLGAEAAAIKKTNQLAPVRTLLKAIAAGKKAQDPPGFAKEYAAMALAQLEGKEPPPLPFPANSVREEAFRWFPADCGMVMSYDLRASGGSFGSLPKSLEKLRARMNDHDKKQLFDFVDQVGNLRLERFSMAFSEDVQNRDKSRLFFRVTGKGDRKRLGDFLTKNVGPFLKEQKSPQKDVTIYELGPMTLALVANTDVVLTGHFGAMARGGLLEQVLALRDGRGFSVIQGLLKGDLEKVSGKALALMVGEMPLSLRQEILNNKIFSTVPARVSFELVRKGKNLEIHGKGIFDNARLAATFKNEMEEWRTRAIKLLKDAPPPPGIPWQKIQPVLIKGLEDISFRVEETQVVGTLVIPGELLEDWPNLLLGR